MSSFTVTFGGSEHQVPEGITVIGRHSECDIQISANGVSRQHARLINEADKLYIEDLGSRNGTLVNGVRSATRRELLKGDTVKIGEIEINLTGISGAAAVAAAPGPAASPTGAAKPRRDDVLRAMHRKKKMQNMVGLCILLLAAGVAYHFLIRTQPVTEEEVPGEIVEAGRAEP
ncbi:FHA domain-containing protein, partial [Planctomycetota bacterium]